MPATGISFVAVWMLPRSRVSHSDESGTVSGILAWTRISVAPNNTEKIIPATAAARGVVNWRRVGPEGGPDDVDTASSRQNAAPVAGTSRG